MSVLLRFSRLSAAQKPHSVAAAASARFRTSIRYFSDNAIAEEPRDAMPYDVVTVGGGPAGLAAAIRLKQLAAEKGKDISVCVVEKGAEIGAHILSGNVFEPRALDELIPDWRDRSPPTLTKVTGDQFHILTESKSFQLPNALLPSQLHNDSNYIISLSQLTRWLAQQAEELGVEIYSGFAASEVLYTPEGAVRGVATRDVGIAKNGHKKDTFERGVELHARQTLFAEGARGSCSLDVMDKFNLRAGKDEQTYGLGVKEVWRVPKANFQSGLVMHTLGWPLQNSLMSDTFGGAFLYHMEPDLVLLGLVVGTDYKNPYLSPYREFQRWKHHPEVLKHIEGGECIAYGARSLNEGGFHAIPKLTFPGGALIGCSAGFLNAVKIKGTHTAIKSGMLAAEAVYDKIASSYEASVGETEYDPAEPVYEASEYEEYFKNSWVHKELYEIRNTHAAFSAGLAAGMVYTGLSAWITKGREPWTFRNKVKDCDKTKKASECTPIEYPKPDGKISFDLLSNLQRSGTNHNHDQPAHLRVKPELSHIPSEVSITEYAGPEQRFCPAGVYEYTEPDTSGKRNLVINAQNCVHCKACSIKTPREFIKWTVPEGGGGPSYTLM